MNRSESPRQFSQTRGHWSQRMDNYPKELSSEYKKILAGGYFDKGNNLLPAVIQEWPQKLAKDFLDAKPKLTSSQLRRFFNMIRTLEQRLEAKQPFDRIREQLLVLKPLAASAVGRKTASELFKQFIDFNVELAVKSEESFTRGFIIHMQSVVAYLKYLEEK